MKPEEQLAEEMHPRMRDKWLKTGMDDALLEVLVEAIRSRDAEWEKEQIELPEEVQKLIEIGRKLERKDNIKIVEDLKFIPLDRKDYMIYYADLMHELKRGELVEIPTISAEVNGSAELPRPSSEVKKAKSDFHCGDLECKECPVWCISCTTKIINNAVAKAKSDWEEEQHDGLSHLRHAVEIKKKVILDLLAWFEEEIEKIHILCMKMFTLSDSAMTGITEYKNFLDESIAQKRKELKA